MSIIWNDTITDRSKADVDRVIELNNKLRDGTITPEEKTEWLNDMKGALNTSDLSRIENDIQLLSDVLELDLTTYIGNIPTYPRVAYYTNLLNNVQAIYDYGLRHIDTPNVPTHPLNSYTKWNDIEKILQDVYTILTSNFYYHCDEGYYCGDQIGLLL